MRQNPQELWVPSQFKNSKQKVAFSLIVMIFLLGPMLFSPLLSLEDLLTYPNNDSGAFHYNRHLLFEEDSDVDILFLGSSYIRWQIDGVRAQELLSAKLKRQARVRLLSFDMRANELLYLYLKEFLRRRSVKYVVLTPNMRTRYGFPHRYLYQLGQLPSLLVSGLNFREYFKLYAQAVYGLVFRARAALVGYSSPLDLSAKSRLGTKVMGEKSSLMDESMKVTKPGRKMVFSDSSSADLKIIDYLFENHERVYFKKILGLLKSRGVPYGVLIPPSEIQRDQSNPLYASKVIMQGDLFKTFDPNFKVIGLPLNQIFPVQDENVMASHFIGIHLNYRGASWFTEQIFDGVFHAFKARQNQ